MKVLTEESGCDCLHVRRAMLDSLWRAFADFVLNFCSFERAG